MERSLTNIESANIRYDVTEYSRRSWVQSVPDAEGARWNHEMRWRYDDGTEATLTGNHLFGEVLPAKVGFEMISVAYELKDDSAFVQRQPIIGWRASSYQRDGNELEPLVQSLVDDRTEFCGILQPDGRVLSSGYWYPNEKAFLEATKPAWLRKKEQLLLRERHKDCRFCATIWRRDDDDIPF
jgi:hypothetical protein